MKTSRALSVILACLAGGVGIRLALSGKAPHPRQSPQPAASAAAARPAEAEMLTARGGLRQRLLLAWLPGAGGEELLRAAEIFAKSESVDDDLSLRLLMLRWAEVNPGAMVAWTREKSRGFYAPVNHAFIAWAQVDFDSAWAAAITGQGLWDMRGAAVAGLAVIDPDKSLRLLRADPAILGLADYEALGQIMYGLAARDPAALAELLAGLPLERRQYLADAFAVAWAKRDPAAAVAWMNTQPDIAGRGLGESGRWIVAHAPEKLPALLANIPAGRRRGLLQAAAFAQLAASDPAAARLQLDAMPATPARQYHRALLLKALCARGHDAGATALASQIGWTVQYEWCPAYSESRYGKDLAGGSIAYSNEEEPILQAMRELMGRIAVRDPNQVASLLAGCPSTVVEKLLSGDSAAHPAAMADLLAKAGDPKSKEYLEILAGKWMREDPVTAVSWAAAHDPHLFSFVAQWGHDPQAALDWLSTQPAKIRAPWIYEIIATWDRQRGANLHAAIRSSSLPDVEKQELLKRLLPP